MASWCLTKQAALNFKQALKSGEINPEVMAKMDSTKRREFIAKYVGKENAKQVNSLFESKILLKNQKAGYIAWAKKVSGITPQVKRDLLARIERLDRVLSPKEEQLFLKDLASTRMGIDVTQAEAESLSNLSNIIVDLRQKADPEGKFASKDDALRYGMAKVDIENYVNELKLATKKAENKAQGVRSKIKRALYETPGVLKSLISTLDNSFFGRQGIKVLYSNPRIWSRSFLRSWVDIARELKGRSAIDIIRADIYSRPNALNGKYDAGGYGLGVLSEEAYPSSLPEKIPLLGRVFKASQSAYNGAALRMRADLADKYIKIAEDQGINTLNTEEAKGIGMLVSSMTGRGSLGKAENIAGELNVALFSVKFLKSNIDQLTAHTVLNKKATSFTKKQSAKNLAKIIGSVAIILSTANSLDPESVDEDPTSKNFGKVKVWGKWVDITGGMGAIVRLSAQVGSFIYKTAVKKEKVKFGERTGIDMIEDFFEGKASPFVNTMFDYLRSKTISGMPVVLTEQIKNATLPISSQNLLELMKDPEAENVVGLMILDGLGLSVSTYPQANKDSKAIALDKKISKSSLIGTVALYSQALGADPETTVQRMFTGQRIVQVNDDIIIVDRQPIKDSQAYKRARLEGKDIKEVKLEHLVPNKMEGQEKSNNWRVVPTSVHNDFTKVDNVMIRAVKRGKLSQKEAERIIVSLKLMTEIERDKKYKLTDEYKAKRDEILRKYK